ncbi:MAG: oligosaccharide flippase family protein [Candidatus Omnitrophica bacterium]|nr:oligosaccharide flippase family protein [Candidatus Omnitrophota bacterium]
MGLKKKVGVVFIVLAVAAVCELLATIMLGRYLPADEFGKFKFIHTIVLMCSALLLFGQNTAIFRVIRKNNFGRYAWRRFVFQCLAFSAIIGFCVVFAVGRFYNLEKEILFIFFAFLCAVGVELLSAILRADEQYSRSILVTKFNAILFFISIVVLFLFFQPHDLNLILYFYIGVFLCSLLFGIFSTRTIESGKEDFPLKAIKEGGWLFLIAISYSFLIQIDQFFIAKMMGYEELAGYVAIISVTRGFELLAVALRFVLVPRYSQEPNRSIRADTLKACMAAAGLVVLYVIGGKFLLHVFFKGKFDHVAGLLNFFMAIGFFRVVYTIPAGMIDGRVSSRFLRLFFVGCLMGVVLHMAGDFILIPLFGLQGAATSALVAWVFRIGIAYTIVYKEKRERLTDINPQMSY